MKPRPVMIIVLVAALLYLLRRTSQPDADAQLVKQRKQTDTGARQTIDEVTDELFGDGE